MSIFATRFSYNSYLIKCVSGIMITITFHSNGYADFNTLTAKQIIPQKEKKDFNQQVFDISLFIEDESFYVRPNTVIIQLLLKICIDRNIVVELLL